MYNNCYSLARVWAACDILNIYCSSMPFIYASQMFCFKLMEL